MIPNITTGSDFGGLIDYLIENRDHEVLDLQGVSSVDLAADEMGAVATLSNRAKAKLLHLSLSAAHEDGALSSDRWLAAADRMEGAFGLTGHQRVVVRHKDKTHDHVHVFWCTISVETGRTPPKRWFLRKGYAIDGIGPHALSDDQVARVPAAHRARRTYDFILLRRAQHLCRQLEREYGLRQLRSPEQAAAARVAGAKRAPSVGQQKRAERTGSAPLFERADEIRVALDQTDWPSKRWALAALGLDLEPVFRTTRNGEELRGLVIFDRADPGNRMKASQLDTATTKYGWRKLEERHTSGAATLAAWWPERGPAPFAPAAHAKDPVTDLKQEFDLVVERHKLLEREKRERLRSLRQDQKRDERAKRRELMRERAAQAAAIEPGQRRAFYARFDAEMRRAALAALAERHENLVSLLRRTRKPSWLEFLQVLAHAGDVRARRLTEKRALPHKMPEMARPIQQVRTQLPTVSQTVAMPNAQMQITSMGPDLTPDLLLKAINDRRARGR